MDKIDFKKELDSYKARHHQIEILDVPKMQYLMIDGKGDPNTSKEFADALKALYPVAYKIKFASKISLGRDFVVMPLEGLWWADDMKSFTSARDKSKWSWTLMIMQPDWITNEIFKEAVAKVSLKDAPAGLHKVRLETLEEGKCVQTLHIGSYDDEAEILAQIHGPFMSEHGFEMVKKHHEIYLSDSRRVAPDKLRTILRQPVALAR